jgi:hypothetical protein
MKRNLGILLLAFLAVVGFSGAIAAQHVDEGHNNRHAHGPPRSNIRLTGTERRNYSRKYSLVCSRIDNNW